MRLQCIADPYFNHLAQQRLDEQDFAGALAFLDRAKTSDAERNDGQRANDLDQRRGQAQAKSGDADGAKLTFTELAQRTGDPKYLGTAAEMLLSAKQPAAALALAEQGLTQARAKNNRDLEGYFQELAGAAKKQGG